MKNTRDEQKEREEKRFNVVLYGVTESKHMDATSKWNEEELKKVKELAKHVGVELRGEVTVKWRCGRRSVESVRKPRPLVVKLTDDETRAALLQNSWRLSRIGGWERVFVSPDLTNAQREEKREEEKKLREEAERKTEAARIEGREETWIVKGQKGKKKIVLVERGHKS